MELKGLLSFLQSHDLWNGDTPSAPVLLTGGAHRWIEPGPLVLLTTALASRRRQHQAPLSSHLQHAGNLGFLERMDFFRLTGLPAPPPDGQRRDPRGRFVPLTEFSTLAQLDRLTAMAATLLDAEDMLLRPFAVRSLEEAMKNAVQHADRARVRLMAAQRFPSDRRLQIAIADDGIGLLQSLRRNPNLRPATHRDALTLAIQPGVSGAATLPSESDFTRNRGFGLFLLSEIARLTLGWFVLASGDALLVQDGVERSLHPILPLNGTFLAIELLEDHLHEFHTLQRTLIERLPRGDGHTPPGPHIS